MSARRNPTSARSRRQTIFYNGAPDSQTIAEQVPELPKSKRQKRKHEVKEPVRQFSSSATVASSPEDHDGAIIEDLLSKDALRMRWGRYYAKNPLPRVMEARVFKNPKLLEALLEGGDAAIAAATESDPATRAQDLDATTSMLEQRQATIQALRAEENIMPSIEFDEDHVNADEHNGSADKGKGKGKWKDKGKGKAEPSRKDRRKRQAAVPRLPTVEEGDEDEMEDIVEYIEEQPWQMVRDRVLRHIERREEDGYMQMTSSESEGED